MTLMAQAYIHDITTPSPREIVSWGIIAQKLAYEEALRVYGSTVEIEISFEVGSLKTRVKVFLGACITVYGMIATYPDFKDGLTQMVEDAKEFAGSFNKEFISETGIKNKDIVSQQRRKETPGRILRALERLEDYERRRGTTASTELSSIAEQLDRAVADLAPQDREIVREMIRKRFPNLPHPPKSPSQMSHSILRPEDEDEIFETMRGEAIRRDYVARLTTELPLSGQLKLDWLKLLGD